LESAVIEEAFSEVKQAVRRARARTTGALIRAVGQAWRAITAEDSRGRLEHCGYHTDS
jgi:hypothetical protein